jgi:hypothetical protein
MRSIDKRKLRGTFVAAFLCVCGLFAAVPAAFSQGCAMCSSYVEASSKGGQKAVNKGVLLLLIPAAGVMSVGTAVAYRYSRKRDLEQL